jgi:hypothetical protein
MKEYYDALAKCGARYYHMLDEILSERYEEAPLGIDWDDPDIVLDEFICEFNQGTIKRLPLMKLNRWLGYIQGCLIERGYTTVEAERNWTRPLFRPLDFTDE